MEGKKALSKVVEMAAQWVAKLVEQLVDCWAVKKDKQMVLSLVECLVVQKVHKQDIVMVALMVSYQVFQLVEKMVLSQELTTADWLV